MKILFVCNQGRHRSRTAAEMFSKEFSTKYVGLFSESPVRAADLHWADIIVVMEEFQEDELARRFPKEYLIKRVLCAKIPDVYSYQQPELVALLRKRIGALLKPLVE